jgi:dihydroorotate dehydrogenase electron transfer subunit
MKAETAAATAGGPATRDTINLENARVVANDELPGGQYLLRLHAPATAGEALPGSFVHLRCAAELPMRRPMSIMRADRTAGHIDLLYKIHGTGTRLLAERRPGDELSLLGPIGVPFRLAGYRRRPLLIGGGVGIPPMVFLAEYMHKVQPRPAPLLLMGSEVPFPFQPRPSQLLIEGLPSGVIAAMPLMEDRGIASRLASGLDLPGCYQGFVTELARHWLDALSDTERGEVEIFSCGPMPMLEAVAALARGFDLPCQISVEEYMACAVGGCAGCAIPVQTPEGPAMKRVCVDGPVFEARAVFPGQTRPPPGTVAGPG